MNRVIAFLICVFASAGHAAPNKSLLLISLDGVKPEYIAEAEKHGLKIPHLREIWREGAHAERVRGALPTSTYPSHTTIVTGTSPARHGIAANQPFEPAGSQPYRWYWYNEDMKAPALWDAASQAGYEVGSVSWPVTVGARGITYNLPDFTGTRSDEDAKMIRGWAGAALMDALAEKAGPFLTDSKLGTKRDRARTAYIVELIRQKKPRLMFAHLVGADHFQHQMGPFTAAAFLAIEEIDGMVGEIVAAMRHEYPDVAVCVVSDHGFSRVDRSLLITAAFVRAGLITLKSTGTTVAEAGLQDWIAMPWLSGGSAAIVLKNPEDSNARERTREVLAKLASDPANGIERILERDAITELGGTPRAEFWIDLKPGFISSGALSDAAVAAGRGGTHGYVQTHSEMDSLFMIAGPGVRRTNLGAIDMRNIAPTLAAYLRVPFPSAELPPLETTE